MRLSLVIALLATTVLPVARTASAERLPVTVYSAANGLPHDRVTCIVGDSRGFLWFCTPAGLSRFDGQRFVNYDAAHGLSHPAINQIVEARDGTYWVATNGGGVCRFTPTARRDELFRCLAVGDGFANRVNVLLVDRRGRLWAGTDTGLFHFNPADWARGFEPDRSAAPKTNVWAVAEDAVGDVWVGGNGGLSRFVGGQYRRTYVLPAQGRTVWGLMVDRGNRLWIAHDAGAFVTQPTPLPADDSNLPLWRTLSAGDGLTIGRPGTFQESADGHVWIGSEIWAPIGRGVIEFDGSRLQSYAAQHGLGEDPVVVQICWEVHDG